MTGVNGTAGKLPTAETSMFSSMDDATLKAYQARNGIQSTDDFAARVIKDNTVPQTKTVSEIIDETTGVVRDVPANQINPESSMFASMDDATLNSYQSKHGVSAVDDVTRATINNVDDSLRAAGGKTSAGTDKISSSSNNSNEYIDYLRTVVDRSERRFKAAQKVLEMNPSEANAQLFAQARDDYFSDLQLLEDKLYPNRKEIAKRLADMLG